MSYFNNLIVLSKNAFTGPERFFVYSDAQYSLKFPARVVPTPLFLPIYVIMTSFPQKLAKFFIFVDFYFIHSHFSFGFYLIFQTWVTQQVGHGQSLNVRNKNVTKVASKFDTMQEQKCTKIARNYHFQWLSIPITFVIFDVEP